MAQLLFQYNYPIAEKVKRITESDILEVAKKLGLSNEEYDTLCNHQKPIIITTLKEKGFDVHQIVCEAFERFGRRGEPVSFFVREIKKKLKKPRLTKNIKLYDEEGLLITLKEFRETDQYFDFQFEIIYPELDKETLIVRNKLEYIEARIYKNELVLLMEKTSKRISKIILDFLESNVCKYTEEYQFSESFLYLVTALLKGVIHSEALSILGDGWLVEIELKFKDEKDRTPDINIYKQQRNIGRCTQIVMSANLTSTDPVRITLKETGEVLVRTAIDLAAFNKLINAINLVRAQLPNLKDLDNTISIVLNTLPNRIGHTDTERSKYRTEFMDGFKDIISDVLNKQEDQSNETIERCLLTSCFNIILRLTAITKFYTAPYVLDIHPGLMRFIKDYYQLTGNKIPNNSEISNLIYTFKIIINQLPAHPVEMIKVFERENLELLTEEHNSYVNV